MIDLKAGIKFTQEVIRTDLDMEIHRIKAELKINTISEIQQLINEEERVKYTEYTKQTLHRNIAEYLYSGLLYDLSKAKTLAMRLSCYRDDPMLTLLKEISTKIENQYKS